MNLRYLPFGILFITSALTTGYMILDWSGGNSFPLLLFLLAKYSIAFSFLELGLSWIGFYKEKVHVFSAVSRAITSFGLAMSMMLLASIYESKMFV